MKYILDASVALKWVLAEHDSDVALRIRDGARAQQIESLAPEVFLAECGHALFRAARRKLITAAEANNCLVSVVRDCPTLLPFVQLVPRAAHLCQHAPVGFYDALYVALAEQEGCQLITADTKLAINLGANPHVLEIAGFP